MSISGIVPCRFLSLISHLIILIILVWVRDINVVQSLDINYTTAEYTNKETEYLVGLGISLGLLVLVEFIGFFGGLSMFIPGQALLSGIAHTSAAVSLLYFLLDGWPVTWYWYIFGFCSALPAVTEIFVWVRVIRSG